MYLNTIYIYILLTVIILILLYFIYYINIETFAVNTNCKKDKIYDDFCNDNKFGVCPNYYPPDIDYTGKSINDKNCPTACNLFIYGYLNNRTGGSNLFVEYNNIKELENKYSELEEQIKIIDDELLIEKNNLINLKNKLSPLLWINIGSNKIFDYNKFGTDISNYNNFYIVLKNLIKEKTKNEIDNLNNIIVLDKNDYINSINNSENLKNYEDLKKNFTNLDDYSITYTHPIFTNHFNKILDDKSIPFFKIDYYNGETRYFVPVSSEFCDLSNNIKILEEKRKKNGWVEQKIIKGKDGVNYNKYIKNVDIDKKYNNNNYGKIGNKNGEYIEFKDYENIINAPDDVDSTVHNLKNKIIQLFTERKNILDINSLPNEKEINDIILSVLNDNTRYIDSENNTTYLTYNEYSKLKNDLDLWSKNYIKNKSEQDDLCKFRKKDLKTLNTKFTLNKIEPNEEVTFGRIAEANNIDMKDDENYSNYKNDFYVKNKHINDKKDNFTKVLNDCIITKSNNLQPNKYINKDGLIIYDNGNSWSKESECNNEVCDTNKFTTVDNYLDKKEKLNNVINNCQFKKSDVNNWGNTVNNIERQNDTISIGKVGSRYEEYKKYSDYHNNLINIKETEDNCHYYDKDFEDNINVNIKNNKYNIDEWYGLIGNNNNNYMTTEDFDKKLNTDCMILNSEWESELNRSKTGIGLIGKEKGTYGKITNIKYSDNRPENTYVTNYQCNQDIIDKIELTRKDYTTSQPVNLQQLEENKKQEINTNVKNIKDNLDKKLANINTIKNLYNTCITKHTPDGVTEQPVISDDEFNNMRDDKLNNENNWWNINAKDTAISNVNEKYMRKRYSGGDKMDELCPPEEEASNWFEKNDCNNEDITCRPSKYNILIDNYNSQLDSEKEKLNFVTDSPCPNIIFGPTNSNKMGNIQRLGFKENVMTYANKYADDNSECKLYNNKPDNYREPGTDSVCPNNNYCTINTDIHNNYINNYNLDNELKVCKSLNRYPCASAYMPINNFTSFSPIESEQSLPSFHDYSNINDKKKPPNYISQ